MQPQYRQCPDCKNYVALTEVQCPTCQRALPPLLPAAYRGQGYTPPSPYTPGQTPGYPPPYGHQLQILPPIPVAEPRSKSVAGLLALLLGPLGVHGFYTGNTSMGGVMLLLTLISPFTLIPLVAVFGISIVQAFLYWTASDEDFYRKYVVEKRWF